MRLDKYLKVSRIIKRRTIASEACTAGKVLLNGKVAKPSVTVKPGDIIEITFGSTITKFQITSLKESVKKEEAALMYKSL